MLFEDRVKESTTSTGTGNLSLAGALTGFRGFSLTFGTGASNIFYYAIMAVDGSGNPTGDWETGRGHMFDSVTLVRDVVFASSNANAAVNFAAGTKIVYGDMPAKPLQSMVRRLFVDVGSHGNGADITEDTLSTYTLPAGMLKDVGDIIRYTAFGTFNGDTNTKTLNFYFGSAIIGTLTTGAATTVFWKADLMVTKTGSNTQKRFNNSLYESASNEVGMSIGLDATLAQSDTSDIIIKVTGTSSIATANQIAMEFFTLEYIPAGSV